MRILSRATFREIFTGAALGGFLFTFVLFLHTMERLFALLVRSSAPPLDVTKLLLFALPAYRAPALSSRSCSFQRWR